MDGGAWWAAVHGVAKSQTRLSDFPFPLSLVVQCLRHHSPSAGGLGSTPGQGTMSHMGQLRVHMVPPKIPHATGKKTKTQCTQ